MKFAALIAFAGGVALATGIAGAQPISLSVDATKAPTQNIVTTHEVIPVEPGPLTLYYPEWIPGEHGPVGPIQNLAGLVIHAGGKTLHWERDPYNLFAFKTVVPAGAREADVDFAYLGATFGHYSSNRLASPNILVVDWNQNVMYPSTGTFQSTIFRPELRLPAGWKWASALHDPHQNGSTVTWNDTSLEQLMDSPLDACVNFRKWNVWSDSGAFPGTASLNVCADTPEELDASDRTIGHFRALVSEMMALYGARHWNDYHFLLTVSDVMPGEGIEHHESSDDGEGGDYLLKRDSLDKGGDLLSHEFNHSWDGKYRMPAGLYPKNPNLPLDDSLLWVYEGMTQYYGDVISFRDGLRDAKNWPDHVAAIYATYANQQGRAWRTLGDTATSGPFLYGAPRMYGSERRGVDFYAEGELLWMKADAIIRDRTNGKKSLDDFARAFFGQENTGPVVKTYDRSDVIAGLRAVAPYDWASFFTTYVDDIALQPPAGFADDGWKFEYTQQPSHDVKKENFAYSIGFATRDGVVADVHEGSAAWKAGLGILNKLVAVNGRTYSDDEMYDALKTAQRTHRPIRLLVVKDDMYRTIEIPYYDGPRYPHLVAADPGKTGRLLDIVRPRRGR